MSPLVGSALRAANAPIAAPHAAVDLLYPYLFMLPTIPSLLIPTWGANNTTILPSSTQWPLNAFQPVIPVNGSPPRPDNGNTSPQRF